MTLDVVKSRTKTIIGLGSCDAGLGYENILLRSNDGRLSEVYFSDGSVL